MADPLPAHCVSRHLLRVRFCETDLMGIAHHAAYLWYFEEARVDYMRRRGVDYVEWANRGVHMPVVEASVKYKKTARFDELLVVETRLTELRRVSLRFDYVLLRSAGSTEDRVAEGYTRLACVSNDHALLRIPDDALRVLRSAETRNVALTM